MTCTPEQLVAASRCMCRIPKSEYFGVLSSSLCDGEIPPSPIVDNAVLTVDQAADHTSIVLDIANANPPGQYEVWRSTDQLTWTRIDTISGASATYTDSSAMASGDIRFYRLRGVGQLDYSNTVAVVYLQFGGAVIAKIWVTDPKIEWSTYPATVNDDGSAPFNGSTYIAPLAGTRGAVLNTAVNVLNTNWATGPHPTLGNSIFVSPGHFDVGGAWVVNPRYWWALLDIGQQTGLGFFGSGMNSTFIHISSPTTSFPPSFPLFNAFLLGPGAVLEDFSMNQYFDGPDQHIAPAENGKTFYLKNVRMDNTRCRDGGGLGAVNKYGFLAGATPTGSGTEIISSGNNAQTFNSNVIDCEFYSGGKHIHCFSETPDGVNCYNCNFFRIFHKSDPDFLMEDPNVPPGDPGVSERLNLYRCMIDGGNLASVGVETVNDTTQAFLYDTTNFQNRLITPGNYDLYDLANNTALFVDNTVTYNNALFPPGIVPVPTYTVPDVPAPSYIPVRPVFLN